MKTIARASVPLILGLGACASPAADPPPISTVRGETVGLGGDALFSVNPENGTVVVVGVTGGAPVEHPVGRRPHRVIVTDDRFYVSLRGERAVAVFGHGEGGGRVQRLARIEVGHEPMGLALSEDGGRLFVAVSLSDEVVAIDTARLDVVERWVVEGEPRGLALHPRGQHLYVTTAGAGLVDLELATGRRSRVAVGTLRVLERQQVRLVGDPGVSPDGLTLAVAAVDINLSTAPVTGVYQPSGTMVPYVSEIELDPVDGRPLPGPPAVVRLSRRTGPDVQGVTYSPAGEVMMVPSTGALAVFPSLTTRRAVAHDFGGIAVAQEGLPGAGGLVFGEHGAVFVAGEVERGIVRSDLAVVGELIDGASVETLFDAQPLARWSSGLTEAQERGRKMFHDLRDARVTDGTATCSTCHPDGRADGVTWTFAEGRRQTRTLAEHISDHTPLGWSADRPSVAEGAAATAERMLGTGITASEAQDLQAFVDVIPPPDTPQRGAVGPEVARGAEVFAALGCATCHAGAALTDRIPHALVGRPAMATPSLRGVVATPPYLVDGALPTLESVVDAAPALGKGRTDTLSAADRAALLAYLRTL